LGRKDRWVKAVLCAIYFKCGFSTKCHIPIEAIERRFQPAVRDKIKDAIKEAERRGLIYRKGGTKSYGLTKLGLSKISREECLVLSE